MLQLRVLIPRKVVQHSNSHSVSDTIIQESILTKINTKVTCLQRTNRFVSIRAHQKVSKWQSKSSLLHKTHPTDTSSLETLATNLIKFGPVKVESTPRRVRGLFDGVFLFDTTSAQWVWEHKYFPQFWIPFSAVSSSVLTKGKAIDSEGSAFAATVKGKGKSTDRVLIFEKGPLEGLVRFEFKALGE